MQNAFVCGIVAALSFIGFVCIIYFIMLCFYRPKGNSSYIIKIPSKIDRGEAESLIYGAYLKKMIFGDLIFDDIIIDRSELSDEEKELVDILISETDIYINIIDAENDSEEKDERKP